MSGWLKRKSPRPSPSPQPGLLSSGSLEQPAGGTTPEVRLRCDEGGLKNPMDWSSVPLVLKQKFPHWKESTPEIKTESKSSLKAESDRSIHFSGSFRPPDYTIPYMVMDNDTINSIAIKFETTPSDIARINRRHQGPSFLIFPGDVIYVPDIENMPKPPSPPPKDPPTLTGILTGEDSEGNGAGEDSEAVRGRQLTPLNWSTEAMEELSDSHLSIICKFMSEDQGCIHGSLVVNHQTMMFTPHSTDPLVQELGKQHFEIILPLGDITYAALTKDVAPPKRRSHTKTSEGSNLDGSEGRVTSDSSMELTLSLDKVEVQDDSSKIPVIKFTKVPSLDECAEAEAGGTGEDCEAGGTDEGCEAGEAGGTGDGGEAGGTGEGCEAGGTDERGETGEGSGTGEAGGTGESDEAGGVNKIGKASEGGEICGTGEGDKAYGAGEDGGVGGGDSGEGGVGGDVSLIEAGETTPHNNSGEGELSIKTLQGDMPSVDLPHSREGVELSNPPAGDKSEHLKSNEPVFLHLHVRPKSGTTYTYTPINSTMGIDIPKDRRARSNSSTSVQQVKTCFCFAFAEKWADNVVEFITTHHPEPLTRENLPLRSWIEGTYEFITCGEEDSTEGLDFCEDHFETSSWEIMSLNDFHKYRRRLSVLEEMDLPPPILSEESQLLKVDHLKKLVVILPASAVAHDWVLIYSTFRDGISLRTMYRKMVAFENEDSPVVLVVRDDQNKIFGSVTTCPLKMSEKFYGRGESSLYSFESPTEMHHYYWTGQNHYFVKGNSTSISIGSGDGHPGLWIDENFYHGSSYECSTFNNKCLASSEDFICTGVEAWGFL